MAIGYKHKSSSLAFTIVELLVVIVVIGILAAITIVSYTGISSRATVSSLQSDLTNAVTQLKLDQVNSSSSAFPATLALANGGKGISSSSGTTYTYAVSNTTTPQTFCITATKNNISYNITGDGNSQPGICPVLNLDAGNISSYPGTGTTWTDLSGNGNNGTLYGGVTYSAVNGGVLSFDGSTGYVNSNLILGPSCTFEMIIKSNNYADIIPLSIDSDSFGSGPNIFFTGSTVAWNVGDGNSNFFPGSSYLNSNYHHIIVSNNNGTNATLYIDGVKIGTAAYRDTTTTGSGKFYIGEWHGGSYRSNATIPVVRVYNKALNSDEVLQNFYNIRGRYGI